MEHVTINNAYICYQVINNANECYKDADAFYGDTIECLRMFMAEQRILTWVAGKFRKFARAWGWAWPGVLAWADKVRTAQ
jgi:hypothetical protein